jgi:hypothetical protein
MSDNPTQFEVIMGRLNLWMSQQQEAIAADQEQRERLHAEDRERYEERIAELRSRDEGRHQVWLSAVTKQTAELTRIADALEALARKP